MTTIMNDMMNDMDNRINYVKRKMDEDHLEVQQKLNFKLKEISANLELFKEGKLTETEFKEKYHKLKKEGDELLLEEARTHDKRFKKYTLESLKIA